MEVMNYNVIKNTQSFANQMNSNVIMGSNAFHQIGFVIMNTTALMNLMRSNHVQVKIAIRGCTNAAMADVFIQLGAVMATRIVLKATMK